MKNLHLKVLPYLTFILFTFLMSALSLPTQATDAFKLNQLSLEELMDIEVSTASKKKKSILNTASAVHVISEQTIKRSGATNIPDLLRLVPGVQVASINANQFAVSMRGFNGRFASKLLVMIDGRTVYTPLYSGTIWEIQDIFLADVDRIEVIRGPGGSLWGANAVNGIINIITKSAKDTLGGLAFAGGGNQEQGFGGVRYGVKIRDHTYFRLYSQFSNKNNGYLKNAQANDDWYRGSLGFRLDSKPSTKNQFTFQGDYKYANIDKTIQLPQFTAPFSNTSQRQMSDNDFNIMGRWTHQFHKKSELAIQSYYEFFMADNIGSINIKTHIFDIDAQQKFKLPWRQELIVGFGYRTYVDSLTQSDVVIMTPSSETDHLFSFFVQDDIEIVEDKLILTLGAKFEHNEYTGFESQPNAHLLWKMTPSKSLWASFSRALRNPYRLINDLRFNSTVLPAGTLIPGNVVNEVISTFGSNSLSAEELYAFELGFRGNLFTRLNLDVAAFFNIHNNLSTTEPGTPYIETAFGSTHMVIPQTLDDLMKGRSYGAEISALVELTDWWNLEVNYTYFQLTLNTKAGSTDINATNGANQTPHHQANLWSRMNIGEKFQLDLGMRFVDEISSLGIGRYAVVDIRLSYQIMESLGIEVVGRNLLDWHHYEMSPTNIQVQQTEVPSSVHGKLTWRF